MEIWENNPHISKVDPNEAEIIDCHYDLIQRSNQTSYTFLHGYTLDLGRRLKLPLSLEVNRPYLYLSDEEKSWISQVQEITGKPTKYWIINAGRKSDFTTKLYGRYQEVVDNLVGKVQFVQIGSADHFHPLLKNVIDLRGKTDLRQMIRLAYHADGGLGPVTFLQHLMAAFQKPYVCISSGMEPLTWITSYPKQVTISSHGMLSCCRNEACWKSRVVALDEGKNDSLCEQPINFNDNWFPKCLMMIQPQEIVMAIERILSGD